MFDQAPPTQSQLQVQVVESEYQPINASHRDGVQVLSPIIHGGGGRRGKKAGSPSLVLVLIKTYGLQFVVSVFFKVISDLLAFANPLILG